MAAVFTHLIYVIWYDKIFIWYYCIWYHCNWNPCIWYPGSWYHGSSIYSLDLCYLHSHHCEAVTYMNLWAHRINYADSISENYVKLTIQTPSLPNKKIATNKESFRKYFICSIFSSIQSLESQGTSGNRRENEKGTKLPTKTYLSWNLCQIYN